MIQDNLREFEYHRSVKIWLMIGLVMIFFQVVVGGITRLTGSGLSITKWEIVTGTLPPLNATQWEEAFSLYKATPQYSKINEGMTMQAFKFIYFWEYIHRLWARLMGFVFLIPFLIFWFSGRFNRVLLRRLIVVFLLAALVASFGWIMVASGLVNRPWVNAYKLTMHLSLALILYSYLFWTTLKVLIPERIKVALPGLKPLANAILVVLALQIVLGGIVSGMKAGLVYPTWPTMGGELVPDVLLAKDMWHVENFVEYDRTVFMPALIQFLHRNVAYLLTILICWFVYRGRGNGRSLSVFQVGQYALLTLLFTQVLLGILTLVNCIGSIPVTLGVLHQAGALLLLSAMLRQRYLLK